MPPNTGRNHIKIHPEHGLTNGTHLLRQTFNFLMLPFIIQAKKTTRCEHVISCLKQQSILHQFLPQQNYPKDQQKNDTHKNNWISKPLYDDSKDHRRLLKKKRMNDGKHCQYHRRDNFLSFIYNSDKEINNILQLRHLNEVPQCSSRGFDTWYCPS